MRRSPALAFPLALRAVARSAGVLGFCLLAGLPAAAQQTVVVIPAGPDVVMPPRGAAGPRSPGTEVVVPPRGGGPVAAPRPATTPRLAFTPPPPPAASLDLAMPGTMTLLAVVPLAVAAAVLTGSMPGIAGGSGSGDGGGSGAGGSAGGGLAGLSASTRSR